MLIPIPKVFLFPLDSILGDPARANVQRKLQKPVTVGGSKPSNITARKNYKALRKKLDKGGTEAGKIDTSQRLVSSYFNKIVVGSENEAVAEGSIIE